MQSRNAHWKKHFFAIWTGQAVSLLGSQLVQFALVWWLTRQTGSATVLATASLVALLPQILLGPLAGALVDRWNRRLVMIVADLSVTLATVGLAVLFWTGHIQIWHVYLLMMVRSLGGSFHWPAMQASTSLMAPREHLARIQGLNQMLNGGMNILSAPLGALLMELLPMQGVLAVDVVTALLAVLPLLVVAIPQPQPAAHQAHAASVWQDFRSGLRYVRSWPGLLLLMLMAMMINFVINPAFTLLPLLVTGHFQGQAMHLAALESALAGGTIAGGALLTVWGGFKRRILTSLCGLVLCGLSIAAVGLAPSHLFWMASAALLAVGLTLPLVNGPIMAVMQATVAPNMQGRVLTLIHSLATAMMPLSLMVAGPLADRFGVRIWFVVGGIVTLLIGAAGALIPPVLHIEDGRQADLAETVAPGLDPNNAPAD